MTYLTQGQKVSEPAKRAAALAKNLNRTRRAIYFDDSAIARSAGWVIEPNAILGLRFVPPQAGVEVVMLMCAPRTRS